MNNLVKIVIYQAEVKKDLSGKKIKKVNVTYRLENGEIVTKEEWKKRVNQTVNKLHEEHILEALIKLSSEKYSSKSEEDILEHAMDLYSYRMFENNQWVLFDKFNKMLGDVQISLF
ncbi:MAG: hypothetical protein E7231_00340 [Cellulosilyticum sp.]|nr:hypothetical protein [Cellulosilyticum sp.]